MEFTREQLEAIEYNALDDDNNAWVSQLESGREFGFTVSSLAAFALAQLDRAESAEAERDILTWANRRLDPDAYDPSRPCKILWPGDEGYEGGTAETPKEERRTGGQLWSKVPLGDGSDVYFKMNASPAPGVAAACGEPDPHPESECSKREPKGRWVGDREWEEDCSCDLDKQKADFFAADAAEPSRPHESLVWAMFLAVQIPSLSARSNVSDLVRVSDRILDEWRARWPEPEEDRP